MTAIEALGVVDAKMDRIIRLMVSMREELETQAKTIDRLTLKVNNPDDEVFDKKEAAGVLGVGVRSVENYSKDYVESGGRLGLEHYHDASGRWRTTRLLLRRFQLQRKKP